MNKNNKKVNILNTKIRKRYSQAEYENRQAEYDYEYQTGYENGYEDGIIEQIKYIKAEYKAKVISREAEYKDLVKAREAEYKDLVKAREAEYKAKIIAIKVKYEAEFKDRESEYNTDEYRYTE